MRLAWALGGVVWPFAVLLVAALWWGPRAASRLPWLAVTLSVLALVIPSAVRAWYHPHAGPWSHGTWVSLLVWPAALMWPGTALFALIRPHVPTRAELAGGLLLGAITGAILASFLLAVVG
ncbi:MAG TPA: hypothetical protein VNW46_05685 [Gemmatimonadaceae bacterium]|jgi:hypothetical protein|nr:hypothetical protein [Gemmatimonadaceae bacterium]